MKSFPKNLPLLALLAVSTTSFADGSGTINDMHYSVFDTDQTGAICFEVGGVALVFQSDGSAKANAVTAMLISAFVAGKTINYAVYPTALASPPCQAWEFPATVYQITAIAFQP